MKIQISKWLIVIATLVSLMFVVTGLEAKKGGGGKPDKPDQTKAECIIFTGDYFGDEVVEGCCPNDGPFPEYGMTLLFEVGTFLAGTYYDGQLFINRHGSGRDQKYKVQFWNDDFAIDIIGGVIDNDKKNKVLTVTFTNEEATLWVFGAGDPIQSQLPVTFELIRTSDLTWCE